jgi:hypothetical protein
MLAAAAEDTARCSHLLAFSGDGVGLGEVAVLGWNALFAVVAYLVWRLVRGGPPWLIHATAVTAILVGA